jgi:hypothetical protein
MKLVNTTNLKEILNEPELKKLGKEANDESLDGEYLYQKINKLNIPIKTVLLNQEIICGLGNIYVDEVCFLSKLHPLQLASTLTINDCNNIVENSKKTLAYAIECGGTTIRSYTSSLGVTGRFQLNLHVHTKENEPCDQMYDVTGSLCENNDKFAIDRMLPRIDKGDYLVIHDTGAHGFAMGYNYNGKLKSAELLLKEDGSVQLIRRAETAKDYFATFDCFEDLSMLTK